MSEKVSLVIRTKNEEKWISACLRAVFDQSHKNIEVVIVDNKSTDKTLEKASAFDVKIVSIDNFLPGKAINDGIRACSGEIIVILSGHCIPVNEHWLARLIKDLENNQVAGVYGRQEPLPFSSDADKRDLMIVFGLDKKIQKRDPFFHNANSALRREIWEKYPFDENITNIEDREWGQRIIKQGYEIVYEPEASVYHYHGIHQGGNPERCKSVARVLQSLHVSEIETAAVFDIEKLNNLALIPVKGPVKYCGEKPLIAYSIESALASKFIKRVIVATDDENMASVAKEYGAEVPFIRPKGLSEEYVNIDMVLKYSLAQLEENMIIPDVITVLEMTYPFRPQGFLDKMLEKLIKEGFDSTIPVRSENRSVWLKEKDKLEVLGQGFMPRHLKEAQMYISLLGLGFCVYPNFVREGRMLGEKIGVVEISDLYSQIEVRDEASIEFAENILKTRTN